MKASLSWGFGKKEENNNHCHNSKSELPLTARQAEIAFSASTVPIPYLIALCALRLLASKPKEGRDRAQRQAEGREGQTRQGSKQRRKERSE